MHHLPRWLWRLILTSISCIWGLISSTLNNTGFYEFLKTLCQSKILEKIMHFKLNLYHKWCRLPFYTLRKNWAISFNSHAFCCSFPLEILNFESQNHRLLELEKTLGTVFWLSQQNLFIACLLHLLNGHL